MCLSIGYRVFLALLSALLLAALGCAGTSSVSGGDGARLPGGAADTPAVRVDEPGALSSLAVPDGVEPALWDKLTAELSRVLAERDAAAVDTGGKLASAPPMGEASATVLSYNAGSATLSWRYYSHGDYNQDGLVGINDLTPLGQHYGESSPLSGDQPFPPDSLGAVIDGNGDGLINISDITAIGQNYGVRVAGYRIYAAEVTYPYPVEPAGPNREGAMLLATVDIDAGSTIPGERRRFYSQVVPTEEEQYYWVRPYHGYADGVASNLVDVLLPPNLPPEAVLLYSGAARTPAHIRWDALASRDDDGAVVRYEWDFDGDGEFEYDSEGATQVSFYYYEAGQYTCTLRVTDDEGATDTDATVVYVLEEATWHVNLADKQISPPHYGSNSCIYNIQVLDIENMPSLAYTCTLDEPDPVTDSIEKTVYLRALDPHGETWAERQWVPDSTSYSNVLVVEGLPALITHYRREYQSPPAPFEHESWLIYTRAADASGTSWPISEVISNCRSNGPDDWEGDCFSAYQFLIVDSNPALLGYDLTDENDAYQAFHRALDSTGSSWPAECQEATIPFSYQSSPGNWLQRPIVSISESFAFLNHENGEDILFYRTGNALPTDGWAEPVLVDQLEQVDDLFWLLDAGGFPAVVYYDELASTLKYRCAVDAAGSAWKEPVVLSTASGHRVMAIIVDGRPTVVYNDRIDDQTKLIAANDGRGVLWGFPSVVPEDFFQGVGQHRTSFAEVAGMPAYSCKTSHTIGGAYYETELYYGMYY